GGVIRTVSLSLPRLCELDNRDGRCNVRFGPITDIAFYSIISLACASSADGTVMPNALAVLRLITSSHLFGACTGRSPAFSPFTIRSIYSPARRTGSYVSGP